MQPQGGTEILVSRLLSLIGSDWTHKINLIISGCHHSQLDPARKNIVWQHLDIDQQNVQGMQDPTFVKNLDQIIYVSEWQQREFATYFPIAPSTIIRNALEPFEPQPKPKDRLRLIYTSMPYRGLEVLLDAFDLIPNKDLELVIYSSNIIYGKGWGNSVRDPSEALFHRCKAHPQIDYRGYGTNKAVRRALQSSHILAYPSIFRETSCLAAIEAGAAGCKIVTTDLGALPETCGGWAEYTPFDTNRTRLVESYAALLQKQIETYDPLHYNLTLQQKWFNHYYSWQTRIPEWQKLLQNFLDE